MTVEIKPKQFIKYARNKQQLIGHSANDNDLRQLSGDYLPQLQPSTASTSCTTLPTPRNSQDQPPIVIANDIYANRSRLVLFRRLTARHAATDTALDRYTSMSPPECASNTQSTKTIPKLKRSSSLHAIKGAIHRASSVRRQVLRTTMQRQGEPVAAPAPLIVSDPIVRGGTCGVVDRRHPSRNEWLRSEHGQDRKATFLKHVQDGEKVLTQRSGIKRAATIMVQRTKYRQYQTNTLHVDDNGSVNSTPMQRSASLSAIHVNRDAACNRLQRVKSFRHPCQLPWTTDEREQRQQRGSVIARLCAAGFILSATHPESNNDSDQESSKHQKVHYTNNNHNNNNDDDDNVKFNFCHHNHGSTCTFLCHESYSVPTVTVRVSYNKSQLVQLVVPQKISLVNLKTRIENKFHQCGISNSLEDRQLIYTDADSCAVIVNNQKLLDAILTMVDDGPLTFRLA
jgi:hypothetical protein